MNLINFLSLDIKNSFKRIIGGLCMLVLFHGVHAVELPENSQMKKTLRVGLVNLPPYIYFMKNEPTGIAYDVWQWFAKANNIESKYILGSDIDEVILKLARGEIDVGISIAMNSEREKLGVFSLPYFRSHFVFLAKKEPLNFFQRIINVAKTIPSYFVIIFIATYFLYIALFFIFERKQHPELNQLKPKQALELTLWRSLVMGFRSPPFFPTTRFIRALSVAWTLIITTVLFSLFAGLTSTLIYAWASSGERLKTLKDLNNQMIDVHGSSITFEAAKNLGFTVDILHHDINKAIKRLDQNKVPAIFIPEDFAISYLKNHPRSDLYISKIALPSYYVGFLFNDKFSSLLPDVNYSILKMNETGEKMIICKKYLGEVGAELCY